jgi:hypothetical protein
MRSAKRQHHRYPLLVLALKPLAAWRVSAGQSFKRSAERSQSAKQCNSFSGVLYGVSVCSLVLSYILVIGCCCVFEKHATVPVEVARPSTACKHHAQ